MFIAAIERASQFTRPIHTIARFYRKTDLQPGAATLFFVNADGWALTCRHVAQQLPVALQIATNYTSFKNERDQPQARKKARDLVRQLERKYRYNDARTALVELHNRFVNCGTPTQIVWRFHADPNIDLALLHFVGTPAPCPSFPVFAANGADLKSGKFLCRVGYPFPEFTNFSYDPTTDRSNWTNTGRQDTPSFPLEGMMTRNVQAPGSGVIGFELSTPGLRGQSGGPVFDTDGRIWGMQAATAHLDLDFDVDLEVVRQGAKKHVSESAILHVGRCVHVDAIKAFMRAEGVSFQEG